MTTETPLAAVVLAHRDPTHLHRLIGRLGDAPVFLHIDRKTDPTVTAQLTAGLPDRVRVLPRHDTRLATWSLVEAELAGLRAAYEQSDARHIAVLSGADYPLRDTGGIHAVLDGVDESLCFNQPMPFADWGKEGGMWRLTRRYALVRGRIPHVAGIPVFTPPRRALPAGITPRASSQWKILHRRDVGRLLRIVADHPRLVDFWKNTYIPEETFVASMLASPALAPGAPLQPQSAWGWYADWDTKQNAHPRVLSRDDLPALRDAAEGNWEPYFYGHRGRPLFARKFATGDSTELLDAIDAQLHVRPIHGGNIR